MELIPLLTDFLSTLGLSVTFNKLEGPTFLPGIRITNGGLVIDPERLQYPGDILHEAGHLLTLPHDIRKDLDGDLPDTDLHRAAEMMTLAWTYAACLHLQIPPTTVFHAHGYKGGGEGLIANFEAGHVIGLPMLQYYGMAYDPRQAALLGVPPYPHMVSWVCNK